MRTPILFRHKKQAMTREEFIRSVLILKADLNKEPTNFRELKAIYFGINLDYIGLCEVSQKSRYFPSRGCDIKMKKCTCQEHSDFALEVINQRIDEVIESLS